MAKQVLSQAKEKVEKSISAFSREIGIRLDAGRPNA
ncbi:hypothetical protein UACE39S_06508 [Ureibacillus acetophenoni]